MTEKPTDVGIIVGRFQSPIIHEGHQEVLAKVIAKHPRVVVFLGLSPHRCTRKDPYDYQIRKAMFEEKYPAVEVDYIHDVGNDDLWSKNLDRQIQRVLGPNQTATLYGSRDSFLNSYKGKYTTCELIPSKYISASEIRKQIGIKAKRSQDFREGIVYAMEGQPAHVIPMVDVAVFNTSKKELLLVRANDEPFLRFPGGRSAPDSLSYEIDAINLLAQQLGKSVGVTAPKYVTSMLMNDWKWRGQYDKLKTTFFYTEHIDGQPTLTDPDVAEARWVDVYSLRSTDIMPVHLPLVEAFLEYTEVFK